MIARNGKVVYQEAFGVRDPATGAPMQKDSIFRMYSMTKPITGVAVLMLMEEGKIRLTDPVSIPSGAEEPEGDGGNCRCAGSAGCHHRPRQP